MAVSLLRRWVRSLTRPTRPVRTRRPGLRFEPLEDRLTPVTSVDYGGLRFLASDDFGKDAEGDFFAETGTVSVGYTPATTEAFVPLIEVDFAGSPDNAWTLFLYNQTDPTQFAINGAPLKLVAGTGTPGVPLPLWQPAGDTPVVFPIGDLTGTGGLALAAADVKPFEIAKLDFTLTELQFTNPNGPSTTDAQVQFQGTIGFDNVPLLQETGVEAAVDGNNYVIANSTGITVTGASVTKTWTFDGVTVAGEIEVTYDKPSSTYGFGGTVTVTSTAQPTGKVALQNVSAGIDLSIVAGELTQVEFNLGGSFQIAGLTVSTVANNPFFFQYKLPTGTDPTKYFQLGGGLQLQFNGNTVAADFGTEAAPGIIISGGQLQTLQATFSADLTIFGAKLTTDPAPAGLTFVYNRANDQYEMYGGLTLAVGDQTIEADLGTATAPGFVIVAGELTQLNMGLAGSFSIFGLKLAVGTTGNPAVVAWQKADDSYNITGTFTADFSAFQTSLTLGGGKNPKGLSIVNGKFDVGSVTFELEDAELGPLTLNDLLIAYSQDGDSYDLTVDVNVSFPGGWAVAADFGVVDGALNSLSVDVTVPAGTIEIPGTGLSIIDIHVGVQNIENPSAIVVTGGIAMVWGESITLAGTTCYLFRVEGDITADADELIIDAQAQFGAYSNDGSTWQGVLGSGDAKLTLDWADGYYALHADIDGLAGIFDVEGDFVFEDGKEVAILATATVVIPEEVPFVGGDTIGGVGFFFQHVFAHDGLPTSTTFAAWINVDIIWTVTVGFEIVYDSSGTHFSLIGAGTVKQFEQDVQPPVNQNYTFNTTFQQGTAAGDIPPDATSVVLGVDWSKSAAGVSLNGPPTFAVVPIVNGQKGTAIPEGQFAANGISIITDSKFNTPTSKAIQIVGSTTDEYASLPGGYELQVTFSTQGGNPFPDFPSATAADVLVVQATHHRPRAIFGPRGGSSTAYQPVVSSASPAGPFSVTVAGNMDEGDYANAEVTLYQVSQTDPFRRGVPVGTTAVTPVNPPANGVNWTAAFAVPIEGLSADQYTYYAVLKFTSAVNGGVVTLPGHQPAQSGSSAPVMPVFAVQGGVVNQNSDGFSGWTVYLDYNSNGVYDSTEPLTQTNAAGFFGFPAASAGFTAVPIGTPFKVQLLVQGPQRFAPVTMPSATYNGTAAVDAPFALQEKSAIKGTVFVDAENVGVKAGNSGVPGAVVYLDLNGDGRRNPGEPTATADARGDYAFPIAAAGNYTVALDPSSLSDTAPAPAYVTPAGTVGNQSNAYTYGMSFTAGKPVVVSQLGAFDSGGDGFQSPITVVLYDQDTQAVLATQTFTPSNPGTLVGGTRFLPLADPITFLPGFNGIIAAYGFTAADPMANAYNLSPPVPGWTTDGGLGRLTFRHGVYSTSTDTFPTIPDTSAYANPYAAGSLLFAAPAWQQTSPTPRTRSVTVGGGGFSLQEGNDFGALPPAFVSGVVTGYADKNGELQADAAPQPGVTVNLLTERYVSQVNAGGPAVGNYAVDSGFNGSSPYTYAPQAMDTSRAVNPAPAAVYQDGQIGTDFTYTYQPADAGYYTVRLHFAEGYFGGPGLRQFNVDANGVRVLTNYDIFAAAGGQNTAVTAAFAVTTDGNGLITLRFTQGAADQPLVAGVDVLAAAATVGTAVTDADGRYVIPAYTPGRYNVQEVPPAGWRQVAPYHSDLTFAAPAALPGMPSFYTIGRPVVADFNADGLPDYAVIAVPPVAAGLKYVVVSYGQRDGTFSTPDVYPIGGSFNNEALYQLVAGDLDGYGGPDVAVLCYQAEVSIVDGFLNTGQNTPGSQFTYADGLWALPEAVQALAVGYLTAADLNGDGLTDLLIGVTDPTGENSPGSVLVLLNAASPADRTVTAYPLPSSYPPPSYTSAAGPMAVGDLNGDGHQDLVVNGGIPSNSYYNSFAVAYGDGTGALAGFTSYDTQFVGFLGGDIALGDIAGRGRQDVALLAPGIPIFGGIAVYPGQVTVGTNRGDGVYDFPPVPLLSPAVGTQIPAITHLRLKDVDGDLRPDLVLLYSGAGNSGFGGDAVVVYLNTGAAPYFDPANPIRFALPGIAQSGSSAIDLAVADMTNDGLNDILVTSAGSDGVNRPTYLLVNTSPQSQPGLDLGLAAGQVSAGHDLVNAQMPAGGAVTGDTYEDVNRNGRRDTGESGTAGTHVFADLNRNGRYDAGEPSIATIARGVYTLSNLAPGTYAVGIVAEDGWRPASAAGEFVEVTVDAATVARADFGRARRLVVVPPGLTVRVGRTASAELGLTAAAAGRRLVYSLEGDAPAWVAVDRLTGEVTATAAAGQPTGAYPVTVRVRDPFEPAFTDTVDLTVRVLPSATQVHPTPNPNPTPQPEDPPRSGHGTGSVAATGRRTAVVSNAGGPATVEELDITGTVRQRLTPFEAGYTGGLRTATADVTGDGVEDVIVAAGPGGGPRVTVFDGATGELVSSFFAYDPSFTGGLSVGAGDLDGDGMAEVVVAPGPGGGPHVKVFDGRTGVERFGFLAYAADFRGGASVAVGDLDGDGRAEIVTGAGSGGGPHVKVFDGTTGRELAGYMAYDPAFRDGVNVAAGDFNGDGKSDIVTGAGAGGAPHVRALGGAELLASGGVVVPLADFFAGDPNARDGAWVAVDHLDADDRADLLAGTPQGLAPRTTVYRTKGLADGRVEFVPLDGVPDSLVGG